MHKWKEVNPLITTPYSGHTHVLCMLCREDERFTKCLAFLHTTLPWMASNREVMSVRCELHTHGMYVLCVSACPSSHTATPPDCHTPPPCGHALFCSAEVCWCLSHLDGAKKDDAGSLHWLTKVPYPPLTPLFTPPLTPPLTSPLPVTCTCSVKVISSLQCREHLQSRGSGADPIELPNCRFGPLIAEGTNPRQLVLVVWVWVRAWG